MREELRMRDDYGLVLSKEMVVVNSATDSLIA
jgi:hypothetical protein